MKEIRNRIKWDEKTTAFTLSICRVAIWEILIIVILNIYLAATLSLRPYFLREIINNLNANQHYWSFVFLLPIGLYLTVSFTNAILTRINEYILNIKLIPKISEIIIKQMIFDILYSNNFYRIFQGKDLLMESMNNLVDFIPEVIVSIFKKFTYVFFSFITAILILAYIDITFALLLLAWITFVSSVMFFTYKKLYYLTKKNNECKIDLKYNFLDILQNISHVKIGSFENHEELFLNKKLKNHINEHKKIALAHFWMWSLYGYSFIIVLTFNFYQLVVKKEANLISIGDFALVITINIIIFEYFWTVFSDFLTFTSALSRINYALSSISKYISTNQILEEKGNIVYSNLNDIAYKNISLSIDKKNILKNITSDIKFGTKLGIIGESGSGKSSFVHLLIGIHEPSSGEILFNGINLNRKQIYKEKKFNFISSNSFLFERSIYENIAYGADNPSMQEVLQASKLAEAHDFISKTAEGYSTIIKQNGINLSAGQKQRILIARAILNKRDITILDEATSHLDEKTEKIIIENLLEVLKNKTLILITHKYSSIKYFNKIVQFENGKIINETDKKSN